MDIYREEIEDACDEEEEEEEDSSGNKLLLVSSCWKRTLGFVTASHAHPQGFFIHPQSWLAL